jgi:hypothetical protein
MGTFLVRTAPVGSFTPARSPTTTRRAPAYLKEKSRRAKIAFEVILVQSGISVSRVTDDTLRLLGD